MQQQKCSEYDALLREFIKYKEQSIAEKEQMKREIEKCKQQFERFTGKLDKRVDARLKEEKMVANHRLEELEQQHQQQIEQFRGVLAQKDRIIDEIRQLLRLAEAEKRELIQNNTKVLIELSQGLESHTEKPSSVIDHNYKQLLKMYQFLIEENNDLKKEIYILKRNHLANSQKNQSFIIRDDQSLFQSEYKPKSLTESHKGEGIVTSKTQQSREKPKEKGKKPPLQKVNKK